MATKKSNRQLFVLLALIAVVVAAIVLSILLPILQLNTLAGQ